MVLVTAEEDSLPAPIRSGLGCLWGSTPTPDLLSGGLYASILRMNSSLSRISHDPARRGGRACVRDLRISVGDVLGWLASGMTIDQILSDYPELSIDDIRECLAYAASREAHEVRIPAVA